MIGVGAGKTPSARLRSEWHTPQWRTRTRTCPGPGSAMVTSSRTTSGSAAASSTAARIRMLAEQCLRQLAAEPVGQRVVGAEDGEEVDHRLACALVGEAPVALDDGEELPEGVLVAARRRERAPQVEARPQIIGRGGHTRLERAPVAGAVAARAQLGGEALGVCNERGGRGDQVEQAEGLRGLVACGEEPGELEQRARVTRLELQGASQHGLGDVG